MLSDPGETEAELDGGYRRSDGPVYPAGCALLILGRTMAQSLSLRPSGIGSRRLGQRLPTSSPGHPGKTDTAKASKGE